MKGEIEGLLETLENEHLCRKQYKLLEDYINNLQSQLKAKEEENARLKDKIEKAVEYLYEHSQYNDGDGVHYIKEDEYCVDYLLDILKEVSE